MQFFLLFAGLLLLLNPIQNNFVLLVSFFMAYKGKLIRNTKTGQDIRFLQTGADTNGELLRMESTYHAASKEPPPHYHPHQDEDFTVVEGEINIRIKGQGIKVLKKGEHLHIPKNTVHTMWNSTGNRTVVDWVVRPALDTEYFLETVVGLAADGKTNDMGRPSILQVALIANRFSSVFRLTAPPFVVQRILFTLLTPFAYLKGLRPIYKKYLS